MKIIVGFSTTNSIWSRLFRWFMQANISHCYIRIFDEYLQVPLIVHADYPGVIFEHADTFDRENIIIEEFEIEDDRLVVGFQNNLRFLKMKYDWWNIFNWALVIKFQRWFKRKVKHPTEDPKKLICVEFIVRILNNSGITHLPIGMLHPKTFREWMLSNYKNFGWKFTYSGE